MMELRGEEDGFSNRLEYVLHKKTADKLYLSGDPKDDVSGAALVMLSRITIVEEPNREIASQTYSWVSHKGEIKPQ